MRQRGLPHLLVVDLAEAREDEPVQPQFAVVGRLVGEQPLGGAAFVAGGEQLLQAVGEAS
jgi:hypothetical protein